MLYVSSPPLFFPQRPSSKLLSCEESFFLKSALFNQHLLLPHSEKYAFLPACTI